MNKRKGQYILHFAIFERQLLKSATKRSFNIKKYENENFKWAIFSHKPMLSIFLKL